MSKLTPTFGTDWTDRVDYLTDPVKSTVRLKTPRARRFDLLPCASLVLRLFTSIPRMTHVRAGLRTRGEYWDEIDWVRHTARTQLHVKIPPELWAEDRARLAAKLAGDSGNDFKEERKKALRWTKR